MRYYSFQISAFKYERDFFLDFFKRIYIKLRIRLYKSFAIWECWNWKSVKHGVSFNFAKKRHPKVAAVPYCSFLISASKNGNELIYDFFKDIQLNCVIGYKKRFICESIEDYCRSNMVFHSILQNKGKKSIYCQINPRKQTDPIIYNPFFIAYNTI